MQTLEDGSRRIMEVMEGISASGGTLKTLCIFRYDIEDNVTQPDGTIKVLGRFQKVSGISEKLRRRLLNKGAPKSTVMAYSEGV